MHITKKDDKQSLNRQLRNVRFLPEAYHNLRTLSPLHHHYDRSEKCEINQSLTQRISSRTIIIKGLISLPIGIIINKNVKAPSSGHHIERL